MFILIGKVGQRCTYLDSVGYKFTIFVHNDLSVVLQLDGKEPRHIENIIDAFLHMLEYRGCFPDNFH